MAYLRALYHDRYELWDFTGSPTLLDTSYATTSGWHNIGLRAGIDAGVWVDGSQLMTWGVGLYINEKVKFGTLHNSITYMNGEEPAVVEAEGIELYENLNYLRSYNRTDLSTENEGYPEGGMPRVTAVMYDELTEATVMEIKSYSMLPQADTWTDEVDDMIKIATEEDLAQLRFLLPNARGQAGLLILPDADAMVNNEGTLIEDTENGPHPGVAMAMHYTADNAVTAYGRESPTSTQAPDSYATGTGAQPVGVYELAGLPTTSLGVCTTLDVSTGLEADATTTKNIDKTTSSEYGTGGEKNPPETGSAAEAPPAPDPQPPKPRDLTKPEWKWVVAWARFLLRILEQGKVLNEKDLARLQKLRERLEALEQENLNGRSAAAVSQALFWLGSAISDTENSNDTADSKAVAGAEGGKNPDRETIATNPNTTLEQQQGFQNAQQSYSSQVGRTRGGQTIASAATRGLASVAGKATWRPDWVPRFVGGSVGGTLALGGGVRIALTINLDLDNMTGKNTGVFFELAGVLGIDASSDIGGHAAWDTSEPGTDVDFAGWGTKSQGSIGGIGASAFSDISMAKIDTTTGHPRPTMLGGSLNANAGLPAGATIDLLGGTAPLVTGNSAGGVSIFGIGR